MSVSKKRKKKRKKKTRMRLPLQPVFHLRTANQNTRWEKLLYTWNCPQL